MSPAAAQSRSTRCFAAIHSRLPMKWRNGLPRRPVTGLCWRRRACRVPMMMWCDCWCPNCNAAACSKKTTLARHCATISDWRYPGPPIGTRRAGSLWDETLFVRAAREPSAAAFAKGAAHLQWLIPSPSDAPRADRRNTSTWHLQPQQRRVLLAAIGVAVVLGARALRTGKADFDRQSGIVVDNDDLGRVAVVKAGDCGAVDDFGVAGTAVGLRVVKHDVDGQPERAGVL